MIFRIALTLAGAVFGNLLAVYLVWLNDGVVEHSDALALLTLFGLMFGGIGGAFVAGVVKGDFK